jgi:dihydroorotate dehydrogenase electron transfer subunit
LKKYIHDFEVVSKSNLNNLHYLLRLKLQEKLPDILPGQFAEVLVENSTATFLRRPISIHNVDFEKNTLDLYVKCVGKGTAKLRTLIPGDTLNLVYPLGNGFGLDFAGEALLIGGGCGVAPLLYLAKNLKQAGKKVTVLIGARTADELSETEEYEKTGTLFLSTEDGSAGEKGMVTQNSLIRNDLKNFGKIFCCGPELMMKAVASIAKINNISCEVSLENTMACGIGACLCCVTETTEGNKCVCTEGPVFNINELKWQI